MKDVVRRLELKRVDLELLPKPAPRRGRVLRPESGLRTGVEREGRAWETSSSRMCTRFSRSMTLVMVMAASLMFSVVRTPVRPACWSR